MADLLISFGTWFGFNDARGEVFDEALCCDLKGFSACAQVVHILRVLVGLRAATIRNVMRASKSAAADLAAGESQTSH